MNVQNAPLYSSVTGSYTLTKITALGQALTSFLFLFLIMCMAVWVCAHEYRCPGGQKWVLDALKLDYRQLCVDVECGN